MSKVSVLVSTLGSDEWGYRGTAAAAEAAETSGADEVIQVHGENLADARNEAAEKATGDLIVFLDADDRLKDGYCNNLKLYADASSGNVLFKPAVQICRGNKCKEPSLYKRQDLFVSNDLVVGTAMRKNIFTRFDRSLDTLEDWEMFLNVIVRHSASVKDCPEMVYIYNQSPGSRNEVDQKKTAQEIRDRYKFRRIKIRRIQ